MYMYNINLYLLALSQMPDLDTVFRNMGVIICTHQFFMLCLKRSNYLMFKKIWNRMPRKLAKLDMKYIID